MVDCYHRAFEQYIYIRSSELCGSLAYLPSNQDRVLSFDGVCSNSYKDNEECVPNARDNAYPSSRVRV
jgi:hypothetical protein